MKPHQYSIRGLLLTLTCAGLLITGIQLERSKYLDHDHVARARQLGATMTNRGNRWGATIEGVAISCELASLLSQIPNLVSLDFDSCTVTPEGIGKLCLCRNLRRIRVSRCHWTKDALEQITRVPTVTYLDLSGSYVPSGWIAAIVAPKLKVLILDYTLIEDNDLSFLRHCRNLKMLSLRHCGAGLPPIYVPV
jgi:Leucine Rich repeat